MKISFVFSFNYSSSIKILNFLVCFAGLPPSHCGSCPIPNGPCYQLIHGILLPCLPFCSQWWQSWSYRCCHCWFPPWTCCIQWNSSRQILTTPSTFYCTLSVFNPRIWCPTWALFIHHWIKAHQSHQGALASFEPVQGSGTNACY